MLVLVRHGRTAVNKAHRLQGRIDPPLDEVGRAQALQIAAALSDVDRVISSPLHRARETAAAISKNPEIDERWIELDYGDFDGNLQTDVPETIWARWRKDSSFRPPNGETLDELDVRVRAAIADVYEQAKTKNIVIVSHVSPIKAVIAWSLGANIGMSWNCLLDGASISRVAIRELGPSMVAFNLTSHLTSHRT